MAEPLGGKLDQEMMRRLHAALTAESDELFQIIQSTDQELLQTTLKNRNLHEDHLFILLKRRDLSEALLKSVYQYEQKQPSRKLKITLVKNPHTPGPVILSPAAASLSI